MEEAQRYLLHCARLNGRRVGEDSLSQEVRVKFVCVSMHMYERGCVKCPSLGPHHM